MKPQRMKPLLILILIAIHGAAQPLTLTANGTLSFPCEWGAELYASTNLQHWRRTRVFTNETQVAPPEQTQFYKAKRRTAPARILAILDTNQTIRGRCDKVVTNITAVGEGGVYQGWTEYREMGASGQLAWVHFRLPPMPGNTNVVLTIQDCDGFPIVTNITLNPSQPSDYRYTPLRSRRAFAPVGLAPAAEGPYWSVKSHAFNASYYEKWKTGFVQGTVSSGSASDTGGQPELPEIQGLAVEYL